MFNSLKGMFTHPKEDSLSSVVVFLVALPLCLGIALASGAPLFSGIISGVIGGIVIGFFSGSQLSVSGPAAGLVVIVIGALETLGSFEAFLLAVMLSGIIQFGMGLGKAGIIGQYFPSSVIKGMLAAIGLILILKQLPHLVGVDTDAFGEMEFFQKDGNNTLSFLSQALQHIELGAFCIGLICVLIIVVWDSGFIKKIPGLGLIPSGLIAVFSAIGLNALFKSAAPNWYVSGDHLVNLPVIKQGSEFLGLFTAPDFSFISNPQVYVIAVTLAIVASLETLLSVEAVDKLDPEKRRTDQNTELKAQGIGNMLSGLVGGLPITAVIVRSSANLAAGAKSKLSAILHGVLLFTTVIFIPNLLNLIPLSSLAAILIIVGFKLTKPALYLKQFNLGWNQFIPFITTVVAILFTDLLIGILIGIAVGIFFILKANHDIDYKLKESDKDNGRPVYRYDLSEHVTFLNKANIQSSLEKIPADSKVIIDGSKVIKMDHDALEVITNFKEQSAEKNIDVELIKF